MMILYTVHSLLWVTIVITGPWGQKRYLRHCHLYKTGIIVTIFWDYDAAISHLQKLIL
jgi:hypothetical protein